MSDITRLIPTLKVGNVKHNLHSLWRLARIITRCLRASRAVMPLILLPLLFAGTERAGLAATYPATTCAELQSRILQATFGDTIIVNTSVSCTEPGPIMLPYKGPNTGSNAYITIQSSALANLPENQRVGPSSVAHMPEIISENYNGFSYGPPAISICPVNSNTLQCPNTTAAPHHWMLIGLEITSEETSQIESLVVLGDGSSAQNTSAKEPTDIILDRCYIHSPTDFSHTKNGIIINSRNTTIKNSYISGMKLPDEESHGIMILNSSGQIYIDNNYIEASGINFFISNQDTLGIVSNVYVRGNHIRKPLSWNRFDPTNYAGNSWQVKGLIELKQGNAVNFTGNIIENCWGGAGERGYAILINPLPDGTGQTRSVTDLVFSNNIVRHAAGGAIFSAGSDPTLILDRVQIVNNLWEDINSSWEHNGSGIYGEAFAVISNANNVTIEHNTIINSGAADSNTLGNPPSGFIFRNNIVHGDAAGGLLPGDSTLNSKYISPAIWMNNILVASTGSYTETNHTDNDPVSSYSDVGFLDSAHGNYRLVAGTRGKGQATDGKDIGADIWTIELATGYTDTNTTVLPAAPTSLSVTLTNQTKLMWTDNSNNETGFKVERRYGTSGNWIHYATVGANVYKYGKIPDTDGYMYYYRVRATNAIGDSATSNETDCECWAINPTYHYNGAPAAAPGTIQAEDFDTGGEGISYYDVDSGNNGGQYRVSNVDIRAMTGASNGYEVFNVVAGEWLNYTINVTTSGVYNINTSVASRLQGGTFHIEVDGTDITGPLTVPATGSWSTFQVVSKSGVSMTAGTHILRLVLDTNGVEGVVADFDTISIAPSSQGFSDDFNDNTRDATKWSIGEFYSGLANDPQVTVLEQNQQLEITPISSTAGHHHNGYVSAATWNMTGAQAKVEVKRVASYSASTIFYIGSDSNNGYLIIEEDGQLFFRTKIAGVSNTTQIAYDSVQHRFWRFRHHTSTDQVTFETSSDGTSWTVRRTVTRQIAITALRVELDAGTYAAEWNMGSSIFDNLQLSVP